MAERNCPRCTLFNPADATNCAACDMKLPPAPAAAAPLSPAGGEDFSDFDAVPVAALDVNAVAAAPPAEKRTGAEPLEDYAEEPEEEHADVLRIRLARGVFELEGEVEM